MKRFTLTLVLGLIATTAIADGHDPRPELTIAMPELNRGSYGGYDASNYASRIVHNLYDNIVKRDWLSKPNGTGIELVPGLATSWTQISPTEWELKIRQGVKFHNGREMTADDVAFTLSQERREIRNHSIATPIKGAEHIGSDLERTLTGRRYTHQRTRLGQPIQIVLPLQRGPIRHFV